MYKIELHLHTKRNSGCGKVAPAKIAKYYKAAGYDVIAVTQHFRREGFITRFRGRTWEIKFKKFMRDFNSLKKHCEPLDINVLFAIELAVRAPYYLDKGEQHAMDILIYGCTPQQICALGMDIFTLGYEKLRNMADEKGWLLVQAHPYRRNNPLAPVEYIHGIETVNGHPGHDSHDDLALKRALEYGLIQTSGSDYHEKDGEGSGILAESKPATEAELVQLLKSGKYTLLPKRER